MYETVYNNTPYFLIGQEGGSHSVLEYSIATYAFCISDLKKEKVLGNVAKNMKAGDKSLNIYWSMQRICFVCFFFFSCFPLDVCIGLR